MNFLFLILDVMVRGGIKLGLDLKLCLSSGFIVSVDGDTYLAFSYIQGAGVDRFDAYHLSDVLRTIQWN